MTESQTLMDVDVLCRQFQAAYEAGMIHIRLSAPRDDIDDMGTIGNHRFDIRPRLPVLQAERRKSGDPAFTIDRSLLA